MADIRPDQRGVISGMLSLSRNLGLITGASVMGAVFALASATTNIMTARPEAVAAGMRITFAVAAVLIVAALAIASVSQPSRSEDQPQTELRIARFAEAQAGRRPSVAGRRDLAEAAR